jgi:uncharacterized protein (TIGR02265 family)
VLAVSDSRPAAPGDTRVVYEQAIEGMYLKGHPKALTPQVKQALRELGIDLDKPLKAAYPAAIVNEATRVFRRLAYGHEPDDMKAYIAMGAATVDGYFNTVIGRAMTGVLKLVPFKRLIDRLPSAMSGGSNYTRVKVEWKGPAEAHVTLDDTEPHPGLNLGVMQRALSHWFGGKNVQISVHEHVRPKTTYRITFDA